MNNKIKTLTVSDFRGIKGKRELDLKEADLIVFYGMNGFGKTSFFDAFEWGFTGKLARYERYLDVGWKLNFNQEKEVLRHKYSPTPDSYVTIELNNGQKFGRRVILNEANCDYNEGEKIIGSNFGIKGLCLEDINEDYLHGYFSATHFLSQETVNHFITSKKPEDRYKAISVNFGTTVFEPFNENIAALSSVVQEREKLLKQDEKKEKEILLNLEIQLKDELSEIEKRIVETNLEIKKWNLKYSDINIPEIISGEKNILDQISMPDLALAKAKLERKLDEAKNKLVILDDLINGHDEWTKKVKEFSDEMTKLKVLEEKIAQVELLNKQIGESKIELENANRLKVKKEVELKKVGKIIEGLSGFLKKKEKIGDVESQASKNQKLIEESKALLPGLENSNRTKKTLLLQKQQAEIQYVEIINTIKNEQESWSSFKGVTALLDTQIIEDQKRVERLDLLRVRIKSVRELLTEEVLEVKAVESLQDIVAIKNLEKIVELNLEKKDLRESIKELEALKKQQEADFELLKERMSVKKKFLENALTFINENSHDQCPVCQTSFGGGQLEKIIKDEISTEYGPNTDTLRLAINTSKDLLERATEKIKLLTSKSDEIFDAINAEITQKSNQVLNNQRQAQEELEKKKATKQALENKNTILKNKIKNFGVNEDDPQKILIVLSDKLEELRGEVVKTQAELNENLLKENKLKEEYSENIKRLELLQSEKQHLKDESYLEIEKYLQELGIVNLNDDLSKNLNAHFREIQSQVAILEKDFQRIKAELDKLGKGIVDLGINLISSKKLSVESAKKIQWLASDIEGYRKKIKQMDLVEANLQKDEMLKRKKSELKSSEDAEEKVSHLMAIIDRLDKIKGQGASSELLKKKSRIEEKINKLSIDLERVGKLRKKVQSVTQAVPKQLENYIVENLDQNLFNEIYHSLNPHTRFKSMDFEIKVKHNHVGINFIAKDSKVKAKPEYLFSSGQLNTFGISMFLSMALRQNWLNLDVLWLDDPIQNLDDINILSFIDFIRGLIDSSGRKKQVFLSTHDERFYDLIMNKFQGYNVKSHKFFSYGKYNEEVLSEKLVGA